MPRRAVAWSQQSAPKVVRLVANMFQCPEGLLLGRNNLGVRADMEAQAFQCPEGLLLGRNDYRPTYVNGLSVFQCPEGLLLGRNMAKVSSPRSPGRVSVPRRAVAWSQLWCGQCLRRYGGTFQCPEGLLLGRNS